MRLPFFNRPQAKDQLPPEDSLTEDPERQRARHRLIGAVFLVVVAFAGLPLVFDSKPKQYNNDIAIQIVQPSSKEEVEGPKSKSSDAPVERVEVKKDEPKKEEAKKEEPKKDDAKADKANKTDKAANSVTKTLDKGEEVLQILEDNKSVKYIVQIGAFASEERAKNWQVKLKQQKVDSYIELRTAKDGSALHALRSGPYNDRAQAEAAEKKIRYVGLQPKIAEIKSDKTN